MVMGKDLNWAHLLMIKTGTDTLRIVENCLAFYNRDNGFDQNGTPTTRYQLYNNISYKNGADGFQFQYYNPAPVNHIFKNNISYGDGGLARRYPGSHVSDINNNWNKKTAIDDTYFQSLDSTGVSGAKAGRRLIAQSLISKTSSLIYHRSLHLFL